MAPARTEARRRVAMLAMVLLGAFGGFRTSVAAAPAVGPGAIASPRADDASSCADALDTLAQVLCRGELRVGTRGDYPPFGQATPDGPRGFEPALARVLAARLGVRVRFVEVNAADRMIALGEQRVDVLIATTGHTVERDAQALFVQPHYFESHTVLVGRHRAAPRPSATLPALDGDTVCVVVGNATNAELAVHGARLLLFGSASRLIEQIRNGSCALAAHDDSLLLPVLPPGYEVKASFAPLPWGVVVSREGGTTLARRLGSALRALHVDGGLQRIAQQQGVASPWLKAQQARWSTPPCITTAADDDPRCTDPPHDSRLAPTPVAAAAAALERWLADRCGVPVTLAMLKTRVALHLFLQGAAYSVALAAGAVAATILFALGFAAGRASATRWVRWPVLALRTATQSTPLVLLMSGAGVVLGSTGSFTPATAWFTAVMVLGVFNGSHASQAVAEARAGLLSRGLPAGLGAAALAAHAQIVAFAVNATRASPVASMIGVPELLAAQTDIASFSSDSTTTFALLLVFYMALVSLVAALLGHAQRLLRDGGAAS